MFSSCCLADLEAETVDAASVDWLVGVDPPGEELELVSASSNGDGGELVLAHLCIGVQAGAVATDPDTATFRGITGTGSRADGAWLLGIAIGILAGVVVLAPPRSSARRR